MFGSEEEDAQRRDFTINGLFYDPATDEVIDHVDGLSDLENRVVRTIGEPEVRFKEDPVRMLRAVKFAARCNLTIEEDTYAQILAHAGEVSKCPKARTSEEFFRLLRARAGHRSVKLLKETGLLVPLLPHLAKVLDPQTPEDEINVSRLWAYLDTLDANVTETDKEPSNALVLALIALPPLRDALDPDSNAVRDMGRAIAKALEPYVVQLGVSKRDAETARQVLLANRYLLPSKRPNRRKPRLEHRDYFKDAVRLRDIVTQAESGDEALAAHPAIDADLPPPEVTDAESESQLESQLSDRDRGRRGRRGQANQGREIAAAGSPQDWTPQVHERFWDPPLTEIPNLEAPGDDVVAPQFSGTGTFGNTWNPWGNLAG